MILIHKANIINEGTTFVGSVLIKEDKISKIFKNDVPDRLLNECNNIIDARGLLLIPGVIDDQVHFRDPGFTYKGDISTESRAAVAGGVTSYMEMPNTNPQTVTIGELDKKFEIAADKSVANFSFYLGATNNNIKELRRVDKKHVCGVKIFMGSSTGDMLVDNERALQQIFAEVDMIIATHCEKEEVIRKNIESYKKQFSNDVPIKYHPLIRSEEACYQSSAHAIELADKYGSRLHVLHLSTARELALFSDSIIEDKKITSEACVHHLWFTDEDYDEYGAKIKWNPAIKTIDDRDALRGGLLNNRLDVIATDHAPHLMSEKEGGSLKAASGGPLIQHSLQVMFEMVHEGILTQELVVEKMCHTPSKLFKIKDRGFIREGYYADLVLINDNEQYTVTKDNILYKCGWSPFEGKTFNTTVKMTFVNGKLVFENGVVTENQYGRALDFN